MSGRLSAAFGRENINTQVPSRYGKVDIVVNREYAIELKMPSSYSELIRSEGPISHYAKEYTKVFLYVYDANKVLKPAEIKEIKSNLPPNVELFVKS